MRDSCKACWIKDPQHDEGPSLCFRPVNPMIWFFKNGFHGISTWINEFRHGNKTIYVVFDEESEFSGPRMPKLRPDQVFEENVPYKNVCCNLFVSLLLVWS